MNRIGDSDMKTVQCLGIETTSMASDSDIGTPILALKNHERPKKVIKANKGQRRPKKSKIPKTCNFINIQCKTIN